MGAIIYALKIPERLLPYRFDMVGSSHQIFHVLIIVAASIHMWASFKEFHKRQIYGCPEMNVFEPPADYNFTTP